MLSALQRIITKNKVTICKNEEFQTNSSFINFLSDESFLGSSEVANESLLDDLDASDVSDAYASRLIVNGITRAVSVLLLFCLSTGATRPLQERDSDNFQCRTGELPKTLSLVEARCEYFNLNIPQPFSTDSL